MSFILFFFRVREFPASASLPYCCCASHIMELFALCASVLFKISDKCFTSRSPIVFFTLFANSLKIILCSIPQKIWNAIDIGCQSNGVNHFSKWHLCFCSYSKYIELHLFKYYLQIKLGRLAASITHYFRVDLPEATVGRDMRHAIFYPTPWTSLFEEEKEHKNTRGLTHCKGYQDIFHQIKIIWKIRLVTYVHRAQLSVLVFTLMPIMPTLSSNKPWLFSAYKSTVLVWTQGLFR